MGHPARHIVRTPPASLKATAKKLGASTTTVREVQGIVRSVLRGAGSAVVSSKAGRTLKSSSSAARRKK